MAETILEHSLFSKYNVETLCVPYRNSPMKSIQSTCKGESASSEMNLILTYAILLCLQGIIKIPLHGIVKNQCIC